MWGADCGQGQQGEGGKATARSAGGAGWSRAGWGEAARLAGSQEQGDVLMWRGDWIFLKTSFCTGWMQVDYRSELLMGQPEAETP